MSTIPDPNTTLLENKDALMRLANDNRILSFFLKLDQSDRYSFNETFDWPSSMRANILNETSILNIISKLKDDELAFLAKMSLWSSALRTNLANNVHVLRFLNSLSDTERSSVRSILEWSPALLARFRDEPLHLSSLHKVWNLMPDMDAFTKTYFTVMDHPNSKWCNTWDAFTKGQIDSKVWLVDTMLRLNLPLGKTWILCGWVGTLAHLMLMKKDELKISNIRSFDIDPMCHVIADTLNRPYVRDGWKFKASTLDVNDISYDDFIFETVKYDGSIERVQDTADTIINTSCDHMGKSDAWFEKIPNGKLVILQNNNWSDNDQHDNSVPDLKTFKGMYPMSDVLFEGTLDCDIYKRYMLVGIK